MSPAMAAVLLLLALLAVPGSARMPSFSHERKLRQTPIRKYYIQAEVVWWSNFCGELGNPHLITQRPTCENTRDDSGMMKKDFVDRCRDPYHEDILQFAQIYSGGEVEQVVNGVQNTRSFLGGVGNVFLKAVYRAYTDETFTVRANPAEDFTATSSYTAGYLGIMGPIILMQEEEPVEIYFRNTLHLERPLRFQPTDPNARKTSVLNQTLTLFPDTGINVAPTGGKYSGVETVVPPDTCNNFVNPRACPVRYVVYKWTPQVDPLTPGAKAFYYRSNPTELAATQNAGLYGFIDVEKKGVAVSFDEVNAGNNQDVNNPKQIIQDFDRVVAINIYVQKEDTSFLAAMNCLTVSPFSPTNTDTVDLDFPDTPRWEAVFPINPNSDSATPKCDDLGDVEPHTHHVINGFFYCWLPNLDFLTGQKVRWLIGVLGDLGDTHPIHWHGNTLIHDGKRVDALDLAPGAPAALDMCLDNEAGNWLVHCHIADHIHAGMVFWYRVHYPPGITTANAPNQCNQGPIATGSVKEFWIKSHLVPHDYAAGTPVTAPVTQTANWWEDKMGPYYGTCASSIGDACNTILPGNTVPFGCKMWKLRYVEYIIPASCPSGLSVEQKWAKCAVPKPRAQEDIHLGLSGNVIKAEVGDEITVHFMNDPLPQCTLGSRFCVGTNCIDSCKLNIWGSPNAGSDVLLDLGIEATQFPNFREVPPKGAFQFLLNGGENLAILTSMHPHGVWYTHANEGALYFKDDSNNINPNDPDPYYGRNASSAVYQLYFAANGLPDNLPKPAGYIEDHQLHASVPNVFLCDQDPMLCPGTRKWATNPDHACYKLRAAMGGALFAPSVHDPNTDPAVAGDFNGYKNDTAAMKFMLEECLLPAATYTYHWHLPQRSGPAAHDGDCVLWAGHGHSDEVLEAYAGLNFNLLICKEGILEEVPYTPYPRFSWGPMLGSWATPYEDASWGRSYDGATPGTVDTFKRWRVKKTVADRELYFFVQNFQEQESGVCALNGFYSLPSQTYACDNAFLVDFPSLNTHQQCVPELVAAAGETIMFGMYGMGSEPDFNNMLFNGVPVRRSKIDGPIQTGAWPNTPGVTKIFFISGSELATYLNNGYGQFKLESAVSNFATRGTQALFTVLPRIGGANGVHNPADLSTTTSAGPDATTAPTTASTTPISLFINMAATTIEWNYMAGREKRNTAQTPQYVTALNATLADDQLEGVEETETTIGSVYTKAMFTQGYACKPTTLGRACNATDVSTTGTGKKLRQYGLTGPLIKVSPGQKFSINLLNKDVPFPVTLKFSCALQTVKDGGFVDVNKTGTFDYFVPSFLDPFTALSGQCRTKVSCLYFSVPKDMTLPPSTTDISYYSQNSHFLAEHVHSGLAGVLIITTNTPPAQISAACAAIANQYDPNTDYTTDTTLVPAGPDIPLLLHVFDENRAHPTLRAATKQLHSAYMNPDGTQLNATQLRQRPFTKTKLRMLRWKTKVIQTNDPITGVPMPGITDCVGSAIAADDRALTGANGRAPVIKCRPKSTDPTKDLTKGPPADPFQYIFEPTPQLYWKDLRCQAPEYSWCSNGVCQNFPQCGDIPGNTNPLCGSMTYPPTQPPAGGVLFNESLATPVGQKTALTGSCPICNYAPGYNFEFPDGCDPFIYNYPNIKRPINGLMYGAGSTVNDLKLMNDQLKTKFGLDAVPIRPLPILKKGKAYRFHAVAPQGDYYYYFDSLQTEDVFSVTFQTVTSAGAQAKLPVALAQDTSSLTAASITVRGSKVLWPCTTTELDVYIPAIVTADTLRIYDDNELHAWMGQETALRIV